MAWSSPPGVRLSKRQRRELTKLAADGRDALDHVHACRKRAEWCHVLGDRAALLRVAAGAWHGRGLVCYASSGKEGNRRFPEHALYDLRSEEAAFAAMAAALGGARFSDPEEVAHAILYPASDESRAVTGADLVIDGGYRA